MTVAPGVILTDTTSNPSEATVDDVTLLAGDLEPKDLSDDQIDRLRDTGVKLEVVGEKDPIDSLQGQALDNAIEDRGIDLPSNATADQKRQALKDLRDNA
jgi:hypothetical protein